MFLSHPCFSPSSHPPPLSVSLKSMSISSKKKELVWHNGRKRGFRNRKRLKTRFKSYLCHFLDNITLGKALYLSGPHFLICKMEIMPPISQCVVVRIRKNTYNNSWHIKGQLMITIIRVNMPIALLNILQGCTFLTGKRSHTAPTFPCLDPKDSILVIHN